MNADVLHWPGVFCAERDGVRLKKSSVVLFKGAPEEVRVWREQLAIRNVHDGDIRLISEEFWTGDPTQRHGTLDEALLADRKIIPA